MSARRDYDYLFKLVIIGDSGVGKSSLLMRFAVCPGGCRRGAGRSTFVVPAAGRHVPRGVHQHDRGGLCEYEFVWVRMMVGHRPTRPLQRYRTVTVDGKVAKLQIVGVPPRPARARHGC